jgi:transposase
MGMQKYKCWLILVNQYNTEEQIYIDSVYQYALLLNLLVVRENTKKTTAENLQDRTGYSKKPVCVLMWQYIYNHFPHIYMNSGIL